mmetsp:Transcript_100846/g.179022  ORF Transcript_100846/g.179022 Transcript_100846/m.179022 type:complete len:207 (-) Transcript_100846:96-716(-)
MSSRDISKSMQPRLPRHAFCLRHTLLSLLGCNCTLDCLPGAGLSCLRHTLLSLLGRHCNLECLPGGGLSRLRHSLLSLLGCHCNLGWGAGGALSCPAGHSCVLHVFQAQLSLFLGRYCGLLGRDCDIDCLPGGGLSCRCIRLPVQKAKASFHGVSRALEGLVLLLLLPAPEGTQASLHALLAIVTICRKLICAQLICALRLLHQKQ